MSIVSPNLKIRYWMPAVRPASITTFIITMEDGFQMVAHIPYLVTIPKYFTVASEVATIDLLRSSGLPIPKVCGYSSVPDNAAETEYIFMKFIEGTGLRGRAHYFSVMPTCRTRVEDDVDSFPGWRKRVLYERLGDGREVEHPARGRAFLRRTRYKIASMVWQAITARRRSRSM